jgi:hypothetical protein
LIITLTTSQIFHKLSLLSNHQNKDMKDITNGQKILRMQSLKIKKCQCKMNTCTMELRTSNKWGLPVLHSNYVCMIGGEGVQPSGLCDPGMDGWTTELPNNPQVCWAIALDPTFESFTFERIGFTLDEPIFLVDVFRLFRLEWIFLGVFRVWTQ